MKDPRRRKRITRGSKDTAGRGGGRGHSRSSSYSPEKSGAEPGTRRRSSLHCPRDRGVASPPPEGQRHPEACDKGAWRGALATAGWGTGPRETSQRGWSDQGAPRPRSLPSGPSAAAQRQASLHTHPPPLTSRCGSFGLHRNPSLRAFQGPSHVLPPPQLAQPAAEESFD